MSNKENVRYEVHSMHVLDEGQQVDTTETRRTDKGVACDDTDLIRTILHRKTYIREIGHGQV